MKYEVPSQIQGMGRILKICRKYIEKQVKIVRIFICSLNGRVGEKTTWF